MQLEHELGVIIRRGRFRDCPQLIVHGRNKEDVARAEVAIET